MSEPKRRCGAAPDGDKEGKSDRKVKLRPKRIPLRKEPLELLSPFALATTVRSCTPWGSSSPTAGIQDHAGTLPGQAHRQRYGEKSVGQGDNGAPAFTVFRDVTSGIPGKPTRSGQGLTPQSRDLIVGHSTQRSVARPLYPGLGIRCLLDAVDWTVLDHGWTELDIAEKAHPDRTKKSRESHGKSRRKENQGAAGQA